MALHPVSPSIPEPSSSARSIADPAMKTAGSKSDHIFQPFISVIVPVYNGSSDITPLMDCLEAQTYPSDRVEYLLIDNNSQDNTATLLQSAIARLNEAGKQFRYLVEAEIQSSYAARNQGIRAAQGEILVFTDADCRPESQWLQEIIYPFQDPAVGLVAGEIISAPGKTFLERYSDYVEVLSQKHTLQNSFAPYGQTANLAIRRDAFEQVGLFRPFLTTGGDADICWRIQASGPLGPSEEQHWQLLFAENARVAHRHRTTWKDLRSQWKRYGRSNSYLHEIHGLPLMTKPRWNQMLMALLRWLLKKLPGTLLKVLQGKLATAALVGVPIGLYCNWFRYQGQIEANLPEEATQIAWLEQSPTP